MEPEVEAALERVSAWTGWSVVPARRPLLVRLAHWLEGEAVAAGGLGPRERDRIWPRHLLDSLLFAYAWEETRPPCSVTDLGSGVGLPGLPLAILWPDTHLRLVDRSGRRTDLAGRAVRILGLDNVEALQIDAGSEALPQADLVVARAAGPPDDVRRWARRGVVPGGRIAIGGSWSRPPAPGAGEAVVQVPPEVLDRAVWLRIMAAP